MEKENEIMQFQCVIFLFRDTRKTLNNGSNNVRMIRNFFKLQSIIWNAQSKDTLRKVFKLLKRVKTLVKIRKYINESNWYLKIQFVSDNSKGLLCRIYLKISKDTCCLKKKKYYRYFQITFPSRTMHSITG